MKFSRPAPRLPLLPPPPFFFYFILFLFFSSRRCPYGILISRRPHIRILSSFPQRSLSACFVFLPPNGSRAHPAMLLQQTTSAGSKLIRQAAKRMPAVVNKCKYIFISNRFTCIAAHKIPRCFRLHKQLRAEEAARSLGSNRVVYVQMLNVMVTTYLMKAVFAAPSSTIFLFVFFSR